jgi:hypothetical protein
LAPAGIACPTDLLVHGRLTLDGEKISKLGRSLDPVPLLEEIGSDPLRYYLLRHERTARDGDFSREQLERAYATELANGLGNLVNCVLGLVQRSWRSCAEVELRDAPRARAGAGRGGSIKRSRALRATRHSTHVFLSSISTIEASYESRPAAHRRECRKRTRFAVFARDSASDREKARGVFFRSCAGDRGCYKRVAIAQSSTPWRRACSYPRRCSLFRTGGHAESMNADVSADRAARCCSCGVTLRGVAVLQARRAALQARRDLQGPVLSHCGPTSSPYSNPTHVLVSAAL